MAQLAQLSSVDPQALKTWLMIFFALIGIAAVVMGVISGLMPKKNKVQVTEPIPEDIKKTFVSHEHCSAREAAVDFRLSNLERSKDNLWATMRQEDAQIREAMQSETVSIRQLLAKQGGDIERALGRIEGELKRITGRKN